MLLANIILTLGISVFIIAFISFWIGSDNPDMTTNWNKLGLFLTKVGVSLVAVMVFIALFKVITY
jgi:hypothetical protein